MNKVRQPAVAGAFYPQQPQILSSDVRALMAQAHHAMVSNTTGLPTKIPKALIVPHAGYIYSGSTAALAYAHLAVARSSIRRVVLLGPVHRVAVRGLALPGVDAFATPLGLSLIHISHEQIEQLKKEKLLLKDQCYSILKKVLPA